MMPDIPGYMWRGSLSLMQSDSFISTPPDFLLYATTAVKGFLFDWGELSIIHFRMACYIETIILTSKVLTRSYFLVTVDVGHPFPAGCLFSQAVNISPNEDSF
jgi:hypothetical protein